MPSEFKYIDRGFKDTLVMIPGWACDYRIFGEPDLKFNYLYPLQTDPKSFNSELKNIIDKQALKEVVIFGWSMGGLLALDFIKKYPELVCRATLLGIRQRFDRVSLEEIKNKVRENKKAFLFSFYLDMFKNNPALKWFRSNLMKDYLENMHEDELLTGLDYLAEVNIQPEDLLRCKKLKIMHAQDDLIMPFRESQELSQKSGAEFIKFTQGGHAVFLAEKLWTKI